MTTAGRFPLDDRQFDTTYQSPTHALHLHAYRGTIQLSRRVYPLLPCDLTLSPAHQRSAYDLPIPGHHLCIHFSPVTPQGKCAPLPLHLRTGTHHGFIAEKMLQVARLFAASAGRSRRSVIAASAASAALQELLLHIALLARPQTTEVSQHSRANAAVERVAVIVQERLAQALSVGALADEVGLTQNYLTRHFRRRFGMTIKRFLLQRRMERAQMLLVATNMPIRKIAHLVGMPDPQYFNKSFRRCTGTPPSRAR